MPLSTLVETHLLPDGGLDLQTQCYQGLCLVAACITLVVLAPVDLLRGQVLLAAVAAGFGLFALALYVAASRRHYFIRTLFAAVLLTLNVVWFPNAGDLGSSGFFFFVAAMYSVVFARGLARWTMVGVVAANYAALLWASRRFPDLTTPFPGPAERSADLMIGFLATTITLTAILAVVLRIYDLERARLRVTAGALAESREQFARLFQVNPDAVVVIDAETRRIVDANDGFERQTGWRRVDALGRTTVELGLWVDMTERERFLEHLGGSAGGGAFLARLRRRDGHVAWASLSAGALEVGGRRCLLISTRDVSDLIDAERATAESRARLATLIDSTDDLVWMVDARFRLTVFNAAFSRHIERQYGATVVPGPEPEAIMQPDLARRWRAYYTRALTDGPFTDEYTSYSGSHTLLLSVRAVEHDGAVLGVSVFARDISALKQAEADRERMRLDLLQAQKLESLGSLAGGVAHDFNNMLGGILGYADLLLADETSPSRREHLRAIVQAASRSSELTRKLLAFARRGRNIVEALSIGAMIRESVAMLRPSFPQDTRIDLALEESWSVDGDPAQISQVIVNLCINANEAMPGGGTLTIAARDCSLDTDAARALDLPPGPYVELSVSDTGVGMSDEVRQRIFEPFFTTKTGGDVTGTGLGLPTVYGIVHLHRGAIAVRSAPGAGTTFLVYLPKGVLATATPPAHPAVSSGAGLLLVVEDEEMLRSLATTVLGRLGYETLTAADGACGVDLFRERHRELSGVILDLKMPRMGGRDAFLAMRGIDPSVPVLICSGYGDNEEAQGLISLGAKGLLSKPYRMADMAERLAQLRG
jgi:PAS domain S-box-containing protein